MPTAVVTAVAVAFEMLYLTGCGLLFWCCHLQDRVKEPVSNWRGSVKLSPKFFWSAATKRMSKRVIFGEMLPKKGGSDIASRMTGKKYILKHLVSFLFCVPAVVKHKLFFCFCFLTPPPKKNIFPKRCHPPINKETSKKWNNFQPQIPPWGDRQTQNTKIGSAPIFPQRAWRHRQTGPFPPFVPQNGQRCAFLGRRGGGDVWLRWLRKGERGEADAAQKGEE